MLVFSDLPGDSLGQLLSHYELKIRQVASDSDIPGSFWGNPEAGLIGNCLYVRADTPVHSILHEACHYICMPDERRKNLHTDAGGDYDEENAVCYLQILLADSVPGYNAAACMADMDSWGYSFRLGSARAWFETDAEDARQWLTENLPGIYHLLNPACHPGHKNRQYPGRTDR